ncbi:hypothetical protein SAMN05443667_113142 [Flavobacterium gillisiae]|uniref:Uncharacterized protein n=1 Tax=Flavobacterium gillisiae TaxID=150146 RepID=A0A1H4FJ62_9FLAO|nr:hypothetical protein [Flavobacterium gillisiae]SEA97097.1 hypothetical protein SAMN05443667_113142 [Flavobacterium gillisiae]
MGFGFNLFFIFILLPLSVILLLIWLFSKKKVFGKTLGAIWFGIIGLVVFSGTIQWLTAKTELDKEDYYGQYIIDRDFFKGKQANWQYDKYRFEIKQNDSLYFYVTDKERVLKTYKGTISTTEPYIYKSVRLIINMEQPTIHIIKSNPTTYRSAWSFYLVFYSDKFDNMYFKKGNWKPLND